MFETFRHVMHFFQIVSNVSNYGDTCVEASAVSEMCDTTKGGQVTKSKTNVKVHCVMQV